MKKLIILLILLLNSFVVFDSLAQNIPLVYSVENTGANFPKPYLPTINELPVIPYLPDPFKYSDGSGSIKNLSDWRYRRAEIKCEIEHYEIGTKPDRPEDITASYSNGTLTVKVTINGQTLTLTSAVLLPPGSGPFPAVIGVNSPSGSMPASLFTSRNIARITFSHNQVTTYGNPSNNDPYYKLYPDLNIDNTGQYSAWAWGVSRIIDGLEMVQGVLPIDLKHLAVTGCSYAGKLALFAGAFDERIALTISQESGGGGYTTWRYSEEINKRESVETLGKTDYRWFRESLKLFSNSVNKLPYDHHELMAMVAPRALFVTGNPGWVWLADESGHVGSNAAKEVWKALGVPDRFGYSLVGGHNHCSVPENQIPQLEAFIEKFLLGNNSVNTDVATSPYNTDLSPWIRWETPTLSNDTTYFTTLTYPSDNQTGMETNINFKWNKIEQAEKYYIQLSTDTRFNNIIKSDSTTTDTIITFNNLLERTRYYWRIRVKSGGGLGPWSSIGNFVTTVSIPTALPQLVSAREVPTYIGNVNFTWNKINDATQYLVQVSRAQTFATIFKSATVTDTSSILSFFSEGIKYFWRVQGENFAGTGPWSNIGEFTLIYTPTNLELQTSAVNEIILSWKDNSATEDGYIIERKQSSETSFTIIDKLTGSVNTYIDKNADHTKSYVYRVKAYKGDVESEYSNEVSFVSVSVNEETPIPKEHSMSQNYPNPFNPVTKLKFALPQRAHIKLSIFDTLGNEIKIILNKELHAGNHEINFDASNFTSGVYFYRIQTGDFVQTKKMILLR